MFKFNSPTTILKTTPFGNFEFPFESILSPDDLLIGELVKEPAWYDCVISKYDEEEASTDKSINSKFYFKIEAKDGGKETTEKGKSCMSRFNEKALGFGKKLWAALEFPQTPEGGYKLSSNLFEQSVGSRLQVYIKRGKSTKGNDFNEAADFRPLPVR